MSTVYDTAAAMGDDHAKVKQALIDALHGPQADNITSHFMRQDAFSMFSVLFREVAHDFLHQAEDIHNGNV